MKVNFVIRKAKLKKNGCIPIEMSICIKKQRKYVSTGREIKPSDFSTKTQHCHNTPKIQVRSSYQDLQISIHRGSSHFRQFDRIAGS